MDMMPDSLFNVTIIVIDGHPDEAFAWCVEQFGKPQALFSRVSTHGGWAGGRSIFMFADRDAAFSVRMRWNGRVYEDD